LRTSQGQPSAHPPDRSGVDSSACLLPVVFVAAASLSPFVRSLVGTRERASEGGSEGAREDRGTTCASLSLPFFSPSLPFPFPFPSLSLPFPFPGVAWRCVVACLRGSGAVWATRSFRLLPRTFYVFISQCGWLYCILEATLLTFLALCYFLSTLQSQCSLVSLMKPGKEEEQRWLGGLI
jgi:hypothetical protein